MEFFYKFFALSLCVSFTFCAAIGNADNGTISAGKIETIQGDGVTALFTKSPLAGPDPEQPTSTNSSTTNTTTTTPATTTSITTISPTTNGTTIPTPTTKPTEPTPTTKPTAPTPTTKPTTVHPTTPITPTTVKPEPTTHKPEPLPDRKFDAFSFFAGILLSAGILAIALVAYKFWEARRERNYHTL